MSKLTIFGKTDLRKRETEKAIEGFSPWCAVWAVNTEGIINRHIRGNCLVPRKDCHDLSSPYPCPME